MDLLFERLLSLKLGHFLRMRSRYPSHEALLCESIRRREMNDSRLRAHAFSNTSLVDVLTTQVLSCWRLRYLNLGRLLVLRGLFGDLVGNCRHHVGVA